MQSQIKYVDLQIYKISWTRCVSIMPLGVIRVMPFELRKLECGVVLMYCSVAVMVHIVVEHEDMDVSPYREEVWTSQEAPFLALWILRARTWTYRSLAARTRQSGGEKSSQCTYNICWASLKRMDVSAVPWFPLESPPGSSLRKLLAVTNAHNRAICSCFHCEKLHSQTCILLKGYFSLQTHSNYCCLCPTKSMRKSFSLPKNSGRHWTRIRAPNFGLDEEFL